VQALLHNKISSGKQSKHQQQQLQASQVFSALSIAASQQQVNLKGIDPQSTQALSAMIMAATMNRGPVGPAPLGCLPMAAVMAPQGHAMPQSMVDAALPSPYHSGASPPDLSLIHHQQQQHQCMHQLQFQQQQQQHQQ
jgi:hypothetical protein